MYDYNATVKRVKDGDTVVCDVDLGFGVTITESFRLLGCNAPETNTKDLKERARGEKVKAKIEHLFSLVDNQCFLYSHFDRSFERYLAHIYIKDDTSKTISVSDKVIQWTEEVRKK